MGVQPFQLDACIRVGELPIRFGVVLIAVAFPSGNFLDQSLLVGDTPIETLTRQDAEFGLCHIQPAAMLRRVVPLEPLDEPPCRGSGEDFTGIPGFLAQAPAQNAPAATEAGNGALEVFGPYVLSMSCQTDNVTRRLSAKAGP
jgi:hypothetical protein